MAGEVELSIDGTPLPPEWTTEDLVYPDDPEAGPDCVDILPDGRYAAWYGPDEWFEVDPVTNEVNFDRPIDPESIPAHLRDNQPSISTSV